MPPEMPLAEQRPSIVMWHGCGSDPEKFEEESEMDRRVDRFNYYSVYARGTSRNLSPEEQPTCDSDVSGISCGWNAGVNPGSCQTATDPAPDDVHFAEVILRWMADNLCVDMDRVFIAGFSNGGQMAYKLNCELSQLFAGVATNGMPAGAAGTPGLGGCQPQRPIPAINFCGSNDFVNCFGPGGATLLAQTEAFALHAGCTGLPHRSELSSTSFCWAGTDCPVGQRVQGCGITDFGHCWPNYPGAGNPECQDQNPANVDASLHLLDFFNSLPAGSTWDEK